MNFTGPRKLLDDVDLPRIGAEIGVGEDEVHAVLDVEAPGSASDYKGRLKMLFEPHVFYRNLKGAARDRAVREGLAYPQWKRDYPSDSYPRLERAMKIDATAALKSASWGRAQILGENYALAGFKTPQAMIEAFCADEENHLIAMVRFIKSKGIDDELRRHDWAGFARGYNGAGYAANGYHTKLAAAFAKWQKIRDTPWKPELPAGEKTKDTGMVLTGILGTLAAVYAWIKALEWWEIVIILAVFVLLAGAAWWAFRRWRAGSIIAAQDATIEAADIAVAAAEAPVNYLDMASADEPPKPRSRAKRKKKPTRRTTARKKVAKVAAAAEPATDEHVLGRV